MGKIVKFDWNQQPDEPVDPARVAFGRVVRAGSAAPKAARGGSNGRKPGAHLEGLAPTGRAADDWGGAGHVDYRSPTRAPGNRTLVINSYGGSLLVAARAHGARVVG